MKGGDIHELVRVQQHAPKYRCDNCGERYHVRSSMPSCRIARLREIDRLLEELEARGDAARETVERLDFLLKRRLHWPKFEREVLLELWQRYREFKAVPA